MKGRHEGSSPRSEVAAMRRTASSRFGGSLLAVLGLAVFVGGCGGDEAPVEELVTTTVEGPVLDPTAELVTIDASFSIIPAIVSVSKAAKTKLQWHNQSSESVVITFTGNPVSLILPPGAYSHLWQVSQDAAETSHEYGVAGELSGTPPGSPSVDVGP